MDKTKRKRLESKGWRFGSTTDFLGLSQQEAIYIELRLRLSDALKVRRQAAKLSQKALADAVGSSQSRVAKMESNDPSVSLDLLISSLINLGISLKELGRIMGFDDVENVSSQAAVVRRKGSSAAITRVQAAQDLARDSAGVSRARRKRAKK